MRFDPVWQARVLQDDTGWTMDTVRLQVLDGGRRAVAMPDGTWQQLPEAGAVIDGHGIVLPAGCLAAIRDAITAHLGASDSATEAKVLREQLAVEQARVDRLLASRP